MQGPAGSTCEDTKGSRAKMNPRIDIDGSVLLIWGEGIYDIGK